ncbi:MAG: hypothetical protein J5933_02240, partial [Clostridia bacterium]|nr:hypothetical protein [Clostridia bacterium]
MSGKHLPPDRQESGEKTNSKTEPEVQNRSDIESAIPGPAVTADEPAAAAETVPVKDKSVPKKSAAKVSKREERKPEAAERNDVKAARSSGKKARTVSVPGRILAFLGVTVAAILIALLGLVWVLERGPSPTLTGSFTRSMRETSAIRWIPSIFLSEDELSAYISENTEQAETESVNTSLIHIADAAVAAEEEEKQEYLQLIDIAMGTCKGKLLIVRDPKGVILGTSEEFGKTPGLQLT